MLYTITETINKLFSVVTDIALFTIVVFKTDFISLFGVATHLRCGGIFSDSVATNFLLISTVKEI